MSQSANRGSRRSGGNSRRVSPQRRYSEEEYEQRRAQQRRARRKARERAERRRKAMILRGLAALVALLILGGLYYFLFKADRTPPTGEAVSLSIRMGEEGLRATDFVTNLQDNSGGPVTVEFDREPDYTKEGTQNVSLILSDLHRNKTEMTSTLTIVVDRTGPVIDGIAEISFYEGEPVDYTEGITLSDNCDEADQITLEVNSSAVNANAAGSYEITYTATDTSGNKTEATTTVTVISQKQKEIEAEEAAVLVKVEKKAAEAVESCKAEGQTDEELIWALFRYVQDNMETGKNGDVTREATEAYRAFTKKKGGSFTYNAMMKALLTAAGFETMDVVRSGGESTHYWCLVKLDDNWYHIDAYERGKSNYKYWYCFLRTDEELRVFSVDKVKNYFTFDSSLYPSTPSANEAAINLKRDTLLGDYLTSIGHDASEH